MDLISIVIPVYNTGKYLERSLTSVIQQTYTNLEIIIVDDCSTDPLTLQLLEQFAQQDKRITIYHNEQNHCVSYSRNFGVDHCNGKYFAFLDSDDYLIPEYIERLHTALIKTQADFAICDMDNLYESSCIRQGKEESSLNKPENVLLTTKEVIFDKKELLAFSIAAYLKLITTSLYKQAKLHFDESMTYEDVEWPIRLVLAMKSYTYVNMKGYQRIVHNDSISNIPSEHNLQSSIKAIQIVCQILRDQNLWDSYQDELILKIILTCNYVLLGFPKNSIEQKQAYFEKFFAAVVNEHIPAWPQSLSKGYIIQQKLLYKLCKLFKLEKAKKLHKKRYKNALDCLKLMK